MSILYCHIGGTNYRVGNISLEDTWDLKTYENCQKKDYRKEHGRSLEKKETFYIQAPLKMLEDYHLELVIGGDTSSLNTIDLNVLEENDSNRKNQSKVLFVRTEEGDDVKLYFQAIRRGAVIKKGFVLLGNQPCIENGAVILIREQIDAYWSRKDEKLYFKDIKDLERILPHFFEKKFKILDKDLELLRTLITNICT
ncbi:hypothetical protein [Helicobacter mehlei]|uniref:Uncharacterized protein n=1 Tax=Helicobacter mehlei TaxID=2316080 RepID=A0A553UWZ7_9HELI|nr:hypothetical protein [Helicobacter mehlei]TSA84716.1 hypothetical protein FNE76_03870 [Helicobacter mehlei]